MRPIVVLVFLGALTWATGGYAVQADAPLSGSTVVCTAGTGAVAFGGSCQGLTPPTAPTRPAAGRAWLEALPGQSNLCTPSFVTVWASGISNADWEWNGSVWSQEGQRIPLVYSTPTMDRGWVWKKVCTSTGSWVFIGITSAPRHPSPCMPGTSSSACRPGYSGTSFLAAAERAIPSETIAADPSLEDIVGAPVTARLDPVPTVEYANVTAKVPDLGDGDRAELLSVLWIVQAQPASLAWTWPDATVSADSRWIPQTYVQHGDISCVVTYQVTASGYWSDGVSVHPLAAVSVGSLSVRSTLPYFVQQVQPALG